MRERTGRRKNETLTSPGPPLTATFGLLRSGAQGAAAAAAGTKRVVALLLVLQTPRGEEAWRRIVERERKRKRLERGKRRECFLFLQRFRFSFEKKRSCLGFLQKKKR